MRVFLQDDIDFTILRENTLKHDHPRRAREGSFVYTKTMFFNELMADGGSILEEAENVFDLAEEFENELEPEEEAIQRQQAAAARAEQAEREVEQARIQRETENQDEREPEDESSISTKSSDEFHGSQPTGGIVYETPGLGRQRRSQDQELYDRARRQSDMFLGTGSRAPATQNTTPESADFHTAGQAPKVPQTGTQIPASTYTKTKHQVGYLDQHGNFTPITSRKVPGNGAGGRGSGGGGGDGGGGGGGGGGGSTPRVATGGGGGGPGPRIINWYPMRFKPLTTAPSPKRWDKTKRHQLDPDQKSTFIKEATGYALSKSNKLSVMNLKADSEGKLQEVHHLQSQLKLLKTHLISYDMVDVFTIVFPQLVIKRPDLSTVTYDLFLHYGKLTADIVANSNAWYNLWVDATYISENMAYSLEFLKNNTSDSLYIKCLETYDHYHPCQRGGPLMLYLILKRIQDTSESALLHLKAKLAGLKINKITGEDVETAVSFIRSTYDALESASTVEHNYVPDDLAQTVLKVFQTSSVPSFNKVFKDDEDQVLKIADKTGRRPEWPAINETLNLATNTYSRLVTQDQWCLPCSTTKDIASPRSAPRFGKIMPEL